jgi:uncharacterized LabA/DUF88 family protein
VGKNVAVFVDVANIFYAAKAAGVDIDYVLLLKSASAGRDLVRAYAYTGLDPDNENQRNFHSFLARNNYKVVSKDIRKYGDGKVKANLDIELVVDLMKTSRNLDVAVVVSGDGDFAPAIRAVQETGVRVEVISFRGNTSSDLMEVADKFTDITQLAKVERGSTASGRRVASDEEDLSMTEVPDKLSEGTGRGRSRGRGRARPERHVVEAAADVAEPVRARGRGRAAAPVATAVPAAPVAGLVALPGEKLSKAAAARLAAAEAEGEAEAEAEAEAATAAGEAAVDEEAAVVEGTEGAGDGEERRRPRRRRGGRGRGRGRGQEQLVGPDGAPLPGEEPGDEHLEEEPGEPVRPARRPAAFGSVWDSQIGVPSSPRVAAPLEDEEYDDEPAIPEYLLAERRRGGRGSAQQRPGQRGSQRGRGGAYAAAVDRERYGGRGGSRLSEPAPRGGQGAPRGPRQQRPHEAAPVRDRGPERRHSSEPWSEVPPELEELLRTQLAEKLARQQPAAVPAAEPEAPAPTRRRTRKPAAADAAAGPTAETAGEAAAAGATLAPRRRTRKPAGGDAAGEAAAAQPAAGPAAEPDAPPPAPRRRTRKPAATGAAPETAPMPAPAGEASSAPTTRRRTRKPAAATAESAAEPAAETGAVPGAPAPRRRTRKAAPAEGA